MSRQREQKLAAIYDAFDANNYKGVIKLTNAAIQKYPNELVFKSLKAVALQRTGKADEAMQLVEHVLAAAPPDEHVLNMLLLVLKPANRMAALLPAYEAACSKAPGDEELMQGLFACHVRSFNFREQQQVAMKLNKQHPSEHYQWWVATTIALQAHAAAAQAQLQQPDANGTAAAAAAGGAAAGLGADKLLQLAEAMAARLLSKQQGGGGAASLPSWEAVMLYLGLLQAQGKHDAALTALRGPLAAAISLPAERREAEAALLLSKGDLAAAANLYQAAVQEQPDDWALLLLYLDCLLPSTAETQPAISSAAVAQMLTGVEASTLPGFQVGGLAALLANMQAGESPSPSIQERLTQAEAFLASLPATAATAAAANGTEDSSSSSSSSSRPGPLLRGPALAAVELAKRKLLLGLGEQQQLADALLQYHDKLGHIVSCAMDVRSYLALLTDDVRISISRQLQQRAEQAAEELQQQQQEAGSKQQLNLLRRQMAARQIHADLRGPSFASPQSAAQHAQQLMALYAAALPHYEGLDERERGPADELLWLAAAALVQAAALQAEAASSIGYLLQALLVQEAAAKGRPYCAPVRLGLTALHGLLGNARAAAQHFGALDVKHIQHDTLSGQHLLPLHLALGAGDAAEGLLRVSLALFEDHLRDAGDTLMQAFKTGTHTKVLEFVCFKERLERSHSFVLARAEQQLLAISKAAAAGPEQAAAAAAAAVSVLPLSLLGSCDWRGMRFNDDLATRLPWLPPVEGPRHLMIMLWWEQQQQDVARANSSSSSSGQHSCWWQRVAAAEADLQPAEQLRAAMRAAAQQRWLLPHLLAAALQTPAERSSSSGGAAGTAGKPQQQQQQGAVLRDLLLPFAESLGCSGLQELAGVVDGCWAGSSSSAVAASRQLQLLNAAVFQLAASVQEELFSANSSSTGTAAVPASASCKHSASCLVSGLQQLQQQACAGLQASAAYLGALLPGHALSLGMLLAQGTCSWLLVCLEAWSKAVKHARSKKKAKKQPAEGSAGLAVEQQSQAQEGQAAEVLQELAAVQAALVSCLDGLVSSTSKLLAVPVSEVESNLLSEFDPSSNAGLQALVGWEARLSLQPVLVDMIKAQRQVLQQLYNRAAALSKRASHISW